MDGRKPMYEVRSDPFRVKKLDRHEPGDIPDNLVSIGFFLQDAKHGYFVFVNGLLPRDIDARLLRRVTIREVNYILRVFMRSPVQIHIHRIRK